MKKLHYILIGIILILSGIIFLGKNDYDGKIEKAENNIKKLDSLNESLYLDLVEKDMIIKFINDEISDKIKEIDSLKNIEDEIKTPDFSIIPISERNRTIERLARE